MLAPEEIRHQTFATVRRGYDPTAVRELLERAADEIERLGHALAATEQHRDRYDLVATEVASVLRAAHEQAGATRTQAEDAARLERDDAALYAAELRSQADEDRDEAKRLLLRSQERAASLVREAEHQAATIVRTAEGLARSRANQVLGQAQRRLERLTREERRTQERLLGAQRDLRRILEEVGPRPVIDLTRTLGGDEAEGTAPEAEAVPEAPEEAPDPVDEMVRAAVGRAVAHAAHPDA